MITFGRASAIMLVMTPLRATRRLLLVSDRRPSEAATPAAPVRRYRLARLQADRREPAVLQARKSA
jgi:hypothetical protein